MSLRIGVMVDYTISYYHRPSVLFRGWFTSVERYERFRREEVVRRRDVLSIATDKIVEGVEEPSLKETE